MTPDKYPSLFKQFSVTPRKQLYVEKPIVTGKPSKFKRLPKLDKDN